MHAKEDDTALPLSAMTTPQEWRGYLSEYSELYLRTANAYQRGRLRSEQVATRWMGGEPATEQAVSTAEQRLGLRFPLSLRGFLLTSDGWSGVGGWIDSLYSCDEIVWLRDTAAETDLIALYAVDQDDHDGDDPLGVIQRSLVVAQGEDLWLLDPGQAGADGEWAAYLLEPKYAESTRFANFAELFHASREEMEEQLAEDEVFG